MITFWDKVEKCEHKNLSPDYCAYVRCSTPYCRGDEFHCLNCGAYITECGCHSCDGISGWPNSRWIKHQRKKERVK